jgi:hypothetical protein
MSTPKEPGVSPIPSHCLDCYQGHYELVVRDEEYPLTDGSKIVVQRVNYLRCVECGEEHLTQESNDYLLGIGPPRIDVRALWAAAQGES